MNVTWNSARYLLRFDDICPTLHWALWEQVEAVLDRHQIRPLVAVVPDNQDPRLMFDPPHTDFWERVRSWQARGWAIGLHGYQHLYVNRDPGIMRLTRSSEFAGLPRVAQEEKLRHGLAIFAAQGVRADAWVAPSHSFDAVTVELLESLGLRIISDGLWPWPVSSGGCMWIPQQLWDFRPKPRGVWTVCFHPAGWTEQAFRAFEQGIETYAHRMTTLADILVAFQGRNATLRDRLTANVDWMWNHGLRGPALDQIRGSLRRLINR